MKNVKLSSIGRVDRRTVLKGAAAVGGTLLVPAQVRAAESNEPRRGGVLRVSMPFNPAALDPMTGRNLPDFNTLYALYDALIDFDPETLEMRPMLARSFEFTDPTTFVMDLVEGVEFHDGTPFNAEAVVFYIDRCMNDPRSNVQSDLTGVVGVEATGSHQVTIKLSQPNASLPAVLSNRVGCIVSPASIQAAPDGNVDRTPVGTGPFRFVEWRDNDLIRVERNPNYWQDGLPYLDGIEFRIINELNTALRTVTAGQADLVTNLAAQQIALAQRDPNVIATATTSMTFFTAFMNYAHGPLADVKVRQALNYAINREELNQVLMLGLGEPTSGVFPRDFWATDPETVDYYQYDPERAQSLLREAGYSNGIDIATWTWPDQAAMQRQELISGQMAPAGIRLRVTPAQPAQAMAHFMMDQQGDMLLSPTGGLPDPSMIYERTFAANALRNAGQIELPGFRELMDATLTTLDFEERRQKLHELHRFVVEHALHLPQYMSAGMWVQTPEVKDFTFGLITSPKFHAVWLDREQA